MPLHLVGKCAFELEQITLQSGANDLGLSLFQIWEAGSKGTGRNKGLGSAAELYRLVPVATTLLSITAQHFLQMELQHLFTLAVEQLVINGDQQLVIAPLHQNVLTGEVVLVYVPTGYPGNLSTV